MIHTDTLFRIAQQRGCDLRVAAHRHRLQRYAKSFRVRRSFGDALRSMALTTLRRRRGTAATSPATRVDVCGCAA